MADGGPRLLLSAPFNEIVRLLCLQVCDWLAGEWTVAAAQSLISNDESRERPAFIDALKALVDENCSLLRRRWRLDFAKSLAADVTALEAWESTADLLQLANDKAEIEKRIVVGAALLVTCGVDEYAVILHDVIAHDAGALDVDAVVAIRVLEERGITST